MDENILSFSLPNDRQCFLMRDKSYNIIKMGIDFPFGSTVECFIYNMRRYSHGNWLNPSI
jgi:hypothetical protein